MSSVLFEIGTFSVTLESLILTLILILLSVIFLLLIKSKRSEFSILTPTNTFQVRTGSLDKVPRKLNLERIRHQLFSSVAPNDLAEKPELSEYDLRIHEINVRIKDQYSQKKGLDPFEVLEELKELQVNPDVTTFNTLIDICFMQHNHEAAFKLFDYLKSIASEGMLASNELTSTEKQEKAVMPDIITYNTIIKGLSLQINDKRQTSENRVILNKIFKTTKEIASYNLKPNEITYNSVLDACVKAHDIDLAFEYFDRMKAEGFQPDNFTYSTLIKGIKNQHSQNFREFRATQEQVGETDKATPSNSPEKGGSTTSGTRPPGLSIKQTYSLDKVFEILTSVKQEYYFKPDEILFNCVIDACIKFRNLPKAIEVFNEMSNLGLKPSGITYSLLFKGYGLARQYDNVMKIYKKMQENQIKMSEVTYGYLIDACIRCGRLDQAMSFYRMMQQEPNMRVNAVIYSILIKGFTSARNFDQAYELFIQMQNLCGDAQNISTYNAMLECAIKSNRITEFCEIYDSIITKGKVQPDLVTCSTYVKGLCKFGQVEKALNIYNHLMREKVFKIDEVLFNSLLHGLQKAREFDKALSIYQDMLDNGVKPSHITYGSLIKIYSDQMKTDEALELFEQFKAMSPPTLLLYTCVIQSCVKCKRTPKALQLYEEMKQQGVKGIVIDILLGLIPLN